MPHALDVERIRIRGIGAKSAKPQLDPCKTHAGPRNLNLHQNCRDHVSGTREASREIGVRHAHAFKIATTIHRLRECFDPARRPGIHDNDS